MRSGTVATRAVETDDARYALVEWDGRSIQERHVHPQPRVIFVIDGEFEETARGETYRCRPGALIVRRAGEPHADAYAERGSYLGVALARPDLCALFEYAAESRGGHVAQAPEFREIGTRLADEVRRADAWSSVSAHGLLLQAAAVFARTRPLPTNAPAWVEQAVTLLDSQLNRPWTAVALAARLGREPREIRREFRARVGRSVGAYVRAQRLTQARALLAAGDRPIIDIALQLGFYDQSHFNRSFRRTFGMTPVRYRAAQRQTS